MADLLFVAQRIPYPPTKGEKIRYWYIFRHLAERYRVHLGCLIDDPEDWAHVDTVRSLCASSHFAALSPWRAKGRSLPALLRGEALTFPYFRDPGLMAWVLDCHRRHPIAVQFGCSSSMAPYLDAVTGYDGIRIFDFVDLDSDKWAQYAGSRRGPMRWIYQREARLLAAAERRIALDSDISLFVSDAEAALFQDRTGLADDTVIGLANGVDLDGFAPDPALADPYPSGPPVAVFTGTMDYWANVDAVVWFAETVLPRLRAAGHRLRFAVVGARPTPTVQRLADHPDILVTGRVDRVQPYLQHAALAVAPMRIARGIQNKVLEAMAMAKAVVATPQAHEGLVATPGHDLIVADAPAAFADAVARLCREPDQATALGHQARRRMIDDYGWPRRLADLDTVLSRAHQRHRDAVATSATQARDTDDRPDRRQPASAHA